jgi:hypothetical protein
MGVSRFVRSVTSAAVALSMAAGTPIQAAPDDESDANAAYAAAEEMMAAGVTDSPDSIPALIEIAQRHGVPAAYELSPWEARRVVREERESREFRRAADVGGAAVHRASMQQGGMTCTERDRRTQDAQRLARTLQSITVLYGGASGYAAAAGWQIAFRGPLIVAASISTTMTLWANRYAQEIAVAPCWTRTLPCPPAPAPIA